VKENFVQESTAGSAELSLIVEQEQKKT